MPVQAKARLFVIEADEYDNMFLGLKPQIAVVTSVEHDHPDFFPTLESMYSSLSKNLWTCFLTMER